MKRAFGSLLVFIVAVGSAVASPDDLEERYAALVEEFDRSEREAVDIDALLAGFASVLDELEAAGLDSLAVDAVTRAQGLHTRRGELDEARTLLKRGAAIAGRADMEAQAANLTMSLAVTHAIEGDFESFIGTASALVPKAVALEEWRLATLCWFNMGVAYTKLGRFPEALASIEESMSIARRIGDRSRLGSGYAMATELNLNAGRTTVAAALADSAVFITREVGRAVPLGAALTIRANVLDAQGRTDEAMASIEEAIAVRRRIEDDVWVNLSRLQKGLLLLRAGRPAECEALVDSILPALIAQGDPTAIHTAHELLCQALFDAGRFEEAETLLRERIDHFEADRDSLRASESRAGFFGTGGEYYATLARSLHRRGDVPAAWQVTERGHAAVLEARAAEGSRASGVVQLDALKARLARDHAALIQFTDPRMNPLLAFLVTENAIDAVELGSVGSVVQDARRALELMASDSPAERVDPVLRRLATSLRVDRLDALPNDVTRLYVVPPSALAGFSFESLPMTAMEVGDRFAVSYVPSASWLLTAPGRTEYPGIRAFADPTLAVAFEEPTGIESQVRELARTPLKHARKEVRALDGPSTHARTGAEATKDAFFEDLGGDVGVYHFATHAIVNPYAPERSCILLSGTDGLLEAEDIESQSLAVDLVTLSGCATSGGFAYLGEGTFGLTRSFLGAGARAVVSSLWKVEDEAAARFMVAFYDRLRSGEPADVGLQFARRTLRDAGYGYRDRAAFVLTGVGADPVPALASLGPASTPRLSRGLLGLILIGGLIAGGLFARRRHAVA